MNKEKTTIYAVGIPQDRKLTISDSITEIETNAICGKNIDEITVEQGNNMFVIEDGNLCEKYNPSKIICCPYPLVSLPNSSTITLTSSNFIFGKKKFWVPENKNVETIVLGKDVKLKQWQQTIYTSEYDDCWSYTKCFSDNFEAFETYGSLTTALKEWFPNLKTIKIQSGNTDFILRDGVLYSKDKTKLLYCPNQKTGNFQIPSGVTLLNDGAFYDCTKLTGISIPDSVTTMYVNTIKNCEQLKKIKIGKGLSKIKSIGWLYPYNRFDYYYGIEYTEEFLFMKSNALKEINVSSKNKKFSSKDGILYDKNKTTLLRYPTQLAKDYVMPNTVKEVYQGAFSNSGIISMRYYRCKYAFTEEERVEIRKECDALEREFEKCKVKSIRFSDALDGKEYSDIWMSDTLCECTKCEKVCVGKGASSYSDFKYMVSTFPKIDISKNNRNFTVKKGIIYNIKEKCVEGCSKNVSGNITIPGTVESISSSAFEKRNKITGVTIKTGVKRIGDFAFGNCKNIKYISLPDTITQIGVEAFKGCDKITSFKLPKNTTTLGHNFLQGKNLKSISVAKGNKKFIAEDNILYNKTKTTLCLVPGKTSGKVIIPKTVKTIRSYAFSDCTNVTGVEFNTKLTTIGSYAFYKCTRLKKITLNDNVTNINEAAFSGCCGLTKITLGENLEYIGTNAFSQCTSLESLIIPDNVIEISVFAFENCTGLKTLVLGKKLNTIGSYSFSGCTALNTIRLKMQTFETVGYKAFNDVPANVTIEASKSGFTQLKETFCAPDTGLTTNMNWTEY